MIESIERIDRTGNLWHCRWYVMVPARDGMSWGGWATTKIGARRLAAKFRRWTAAS